MAKSYFNGIEDGSLGFSGPITTSNYPLNIGVYDHWSGLIAYFPGDIDDIRIYNRALSDAEIQLLYTESQPIDTTTVWKMQVKASVASYQDNENFAGVSDNASDVHDATLDTAEPPVTPGSYVSLYFPHPEWSSLLGNNFAGDIKKDISFTDTVKRWYFQVISNVVSDTIRLTFANDRIPLSLGKYLTDLSTGKRVNLRNTDTYKYYNTAESLRPFMLVIGDSTPPSLGLTIPNGSNIWRSGTS